MMNQVINDLLAKQEQELKMMGKIAQVLCHHLRDNTVELSLDKEHGAVINFLPYDDLAVDLNDSSWLTYQGFYQLAPIVLASSRLDSTIDLDNWYNSLTATVDRFHLEIYEDADFDIEFYVQALAQLNFDGMLAVGEGVLFVAQCTVARMVTNSEEEAFGREYFKRTYNALHKFLNNENISNAIESLSRELREKKELDSDYLTRYLQEKIGAFGSGLPVV
ncbi:hypothetical protein OAE48_05020 [Flavobacteriales bacterium]|nr:hypothetical protein [Flavobacteriales bacterium]